MTSTGRSRNQGNSMRYVIEHLEPRLFRWCMLEYVHISDIAGRANVIFTNIREKDATKLESYGTVSTGRVKELGLKNACVLDPFAKKTLSSDDHFDYLVLGGILGDEPMQKRTGAELDIDAERRNLGKAQFSTDTAVYVAEHIKHGGKMSELEFQDDIEIDIRDGESVILPFRYVVKEGSPILPDGLVDFLKKRKGF